MRSNEGGRTEEGIEGQKEGKTNKREKEERKRKEPERRWEGEQWEGKIN